MAEHPVVYISRIQDLMDLHEWMDDEDFTAALELATKVIAKPDLPHSDVRRVLTLMQAYALQFRMRGNLYMHIHKGNASSPEGIKKNLFMSMSEQCHELAQTLKYLLKDHVV